MSDYNGATARAAAAPEFRRMALARLMDRSLGQPPLSRGALMAVHGFAKRPWRWATAGPVQGRLGRVRQLRSLEPTGEGRQPQAAESQNDRQDRDSVTQLPVEGCVAEREGENEGDQPDRFSTPGSPTNNEADPRQRELEAEGERTHQVAGRTPEQRCAGEAGVMMGEAGTPGRIVAHQPGGIELPEVPEFANGAPAKPGRIALDRGGDCAPDATPSHLCSDDWHSTKSNEIVWEHPTVDLVVAMAPRHHHQCPGADQHGHVSRPPTPRTSRRKRDPADHRWSEREADRPKQRECPQLDAGDEDQSHPVSPDRLPGSEQRTGQEQTRGRLRIQQRRAHDQQGIQAVQRSRRQPGRPSAQPPAEVEAQQTAEGDERGLTHAEG